MWRVLFAALRAVAGLRAASGALNLWPGRGQARSVRGGRRGTDTNSLLPGLSNLTGTRLSRAGVAAAVETGRALLNRPSVRASLEATVLRLLRGTGEQPQSMPAAHQTVERVALILRQLGVAPLRIGVDGLPGSGKSTLSRALADRLGLKWRSLDHENMNVPRDFSQGRTIYEHHRLFRTQDVDVFDAIVYVHEPVETCKARVLQRAQGEARRAVIIDVLDYDKLQKIGRVAFDVCDGTQVPVPECSLVVKVRPPGGFRAVENLVARLQAAGHHQEGMTKEQMFFLLVYGKPRSGLRAYFQPGAYNEELLCGLLAGLREYVAE